VAVVQSLFGDMLPPTMQDGGGQGAIGMPLPPRAPLLAAQQPMPVMGQQPQATEQLAQQPQEVLTRVMERPQAPVMGQQQPEIPNFDLSSLNLPTGIDLTGLQGGMFNLGQVQPQQPKDFTQIFNDYSSFLSGVQSGDTTKKVNRRDDIYDNYFKQSGGKYQGDPAELRASVGLSDAFSVYDNPEGQVTNESVQGAYQALTSGASPLEALSAYYGFDFQPAVNEGANYSNAQKYGVTAETMGEFQSLVEPILQKSIPYIQATQGLNYTDALEYAYTHDPMINALYQSYGVDLYRQTKDGSTYIYDPIAGQEIRTLEVKDAKFKDFLPTIALAVATAGAGSFIGGALANSSLGAALGTAGSNALGGAVASVGVAAAKGYKGSDLLTAGVLGGLGGYAKGLNEVANGAAAGSQAAIDAAAKANIFSNVSKVVNAADAIANKDYFKLLNMGLEAGGFDSFNTLTANKLNELGGADGTLFGLNVDQLAPAVNRFAKNMLEGKDADKALLGAVGEYIIQGGALDNFELGDFKFPNFDFNTPEGIKGIEDFVKDNWRSLKKSPLVQGLREVGREIDSSVIQRLIDPLKGLGGKLDDLVNTPDSVKAIEDMLKNAPNALDDAFDTPDWMKKIEDWFKGLEFPDLDINMPNLQIPQQQMGAANLMGDFAMSDLDAGIESVTPSELFAQKDYLAGLLD
jgi:hypothetical protein